MQGIDRVVQRVKAMYEPVEVVGFNVFDYGEEGQGMSWVESYDARHFQMVYSVLTTV
jgi:hypothetical protein